jgi:hypothetical protein
LIDGLRKRQIDGAVGARRRGGVVAAGAVAVGIVGVGLPAAVTSAAFVYDPAPKTRAVICSTRLAAAATFPTLHTPVAET